MKDILIKDEEELKKEEAFSKKYVSPFFRSFYLYRYQILRLMKVTPIQARERVMAELNIVWEKIGEELVDADEEL